MKYEITTTRGLIFVNDGNGIVATSGTRDKKRYLNTYKGSMYWRADGGGNMSAPEFTSKKIEKYGADFVAGYLRAIGLSVPLDTEIYMKKASGRVLSLGYVQHE